MAERPDDDNSEDPGRESEDRTDPFTAHSGSSSQMSPTGADAKGEGKRKKFRPLDVVRKLFKRRPKLKEIDSARARSTSALYGHASGEGEEDDEEGGFLSRISLRKNKSRSEDSVLVEARTNQAGILRKLAYSVEGINKSIYSSGKSSSKNSLNSTESQQDHFKEGLKGRQSSTEDAEPSVDLEAVAKTEALNTDAAKFKISVRPKGRKGSRQSRKNRQKVASNLPCLNEEQQIFTNPSLNEDDTKEMTPNMETGESAPKEEIAEPVVKKKPKIPVEALPPKPRPKSTPVTIHSTPETQQRINVAMDLESAERPKHLPNPELLEFGKIRSKSLDIDTKGQRSSDFSLSPARKSNLVPRGLKVDTETVNKSTNVSTKGPEIKELILTSVDKKDDMETLQIEPKLESKNIDLEEKGVKLYGSCEKGLDVGLDSPKSLVSPDLGHKSLKPVKSPVRSDMEFRFVKNLDSEEKTTRPSKSPERSLDLGLRPTKSPIQTPDIEAKPLKPQSPTTKSSDLEIRSILSTPDSEDDNKSLKSPKALDLRLKSPVQEAGDSHSDIPRPLQSPIRQMQDKELKSPKSLTKDKDSVIEISSSQESIQKILKSSEQEQGLLNEEPLETSKQAKPTQTPTRENQKEQRNSQLQTLSTENEDRPKSPKKIIASLELGNLVTKPLRSFSDPKSPRSSLRSPNLSPRSPSLPPKPIRSPLGSPNLRSSGSKSPIKSFEFLKLGSKFENTSESSENLYPKSPQSPPVAPKSFVSRPLKSPTAEGKSLNEIPTLLPKPLKEHSESANLGELSPNSVRRFTERLNLEQQNRNLEQKTPKSPSDTPSFSDLMQKPYRKVSVEQISTEQKVSQSPLNSPNLEDSSENPLLKSISLESKSFKPLNVTDSGKDLSINLESKHLKTSNSEDSNQSPLRKSLERPSLSPKPLKSPVEAPTAGPKFNLPTNKVNKSNKPTETQTEVEERRSQVGKNLELFESIVKKDTKVPVTPKISTGSKVASIVSMSDSSKVAASSSILEKSKISDKPSIVSSPKASTGSSVTANKSKMADSSKVADSSSITASPKVVNTFKAADTSNVSDKPKVSPGGLKTVESNKTAPGSTVTEKPKVASTSKISDSSKTADASKMTESSNVTAKSDDSSQRDPEPKPLSTAKAMDSCKASESPKMIPTPKRLNSSKHSKETSSDEANVVATGSKTIVDCPPVDTESAKPSLAPKVKSFELSPSAANEVAGSGIDVSQNNTNRLSALFEAKSVAASHVDPGTTVKIEVIAKEENGGQKPVKLREKGKSTEKISELSSRQSKVLDLVKNFQKLQAT